MKNFQFYAFLKLNSPEKRGGKQVEIDLRDLFQEIP